MAISKTNIVTKGYHGMVGGEFVFRRFHGNVIIQACPDFSNVTWSPKQIAHRQLVKKASAMAKAMAGDPSIRVEYETKLQPGQTVYNVLFGKVLRELRETASHENESPV
jgi:hypothetical protein